VSVRLITAVFQLDIAPSEKLVLLAMADHAHDDGTGCYPSIELLARKTSQTRRGVQKIMRRLQGAGLIAPSKVSRGGPRRSTEYTLMLANSEPRSLFASTQPRTPVHATANVGMPNREPQCTQQRTGFARTIKNHHEPSWNLARRSPRSSSSPVEKESRQAQNNRARYARIGRFAHRATELLRAEPHKALGDLAEELKQWAATNGVPYFDACSGAAAPIQQAITIAIERAKTA
jgi:Helix-turn-helix domain